MKKTKILIPAIAVLGLGIAASTTATVAWFQSSQTVNATTTSVQTGSLSAGVTNPSVGNFTFTLAGLTATESDKTVDLTEAGTGKSYVFIDATHQIEVNPSNPTCEWSGVTWTISYSGPSDTAAKIQAEWSELITRKPTATVAANSNSGNAHVIRFGASGSSAAQCNSNDTYELGTVTLSQISWTSISVTGDAAPYSASQAATAKLSHTGFATALTGLATNEGALAEFSGAHAFTISTVLNDA